MDIAFGVLLAPLLLLLPPASCVDVSFDFASFSFLNLTLLGDSYLKNGTIGLTRETDVPSSSAGAAICTLPIRFLDPGTDAAASFAAKFSFSVTNPNPDSYGDGLTFFISPGNATIGSTGGYLGLFSPSGNSSGGGNGSIIAIEFDARLDVGLGDPSGNHVGLDVDSPISKASVDLTPYGIDLKSGKLITAWVDYHQNVTMLKVWLGYTDVKPKDPVLITTVDLSKHFAEYMYVGFSASTEGSTEVHTIDGWTFQAFSSAAVANTTPSVPHNASGGSWSAIPAIPMANARDGPHRKLGLGLAIIGPATFAVAFAVLVWVSAKKWLEKKANKEVFKSEFLKGPRKRPIDFKDNKEHKLVNLVDWVWRLYSEDRLIEAADSKLNGEFDEGEMLRLLLVGLSCANPNCAERPTMRRVLQILNREAEPMAVPKKKPLLMFTSAASFSMTEIVSDIEGSTVITISTQI
ncbi:hypothetical protein OPV22_018569 [Ensete ventricosum]|uniref:Legume lectin domain-containing protein n=1 Tax=Ensete ventricosum TaxID=4639 RepID=A0AAV8QQR5_ENSVE|nr:hypothetical protein OPV22_018569 [Ensete ventricosum]